MTTPPRTPTPLDAAWEALRDTLWQNAPSYDPAEFIARHRPLIEAEATAAERTRIYGQLVDRLWGCDADANAVLDIVEDHT